MSSGYLNRIHFTPGGANWKELDPSEPWLNIPGLDFKFIGETWPEAALEGWVSPQVNAMNQVVLRTLWTNSNDEGVPGYADYILLFGTFNEDDPDLLGSATYGYMLIRVDLNAITGDYMQDMIDIDVSHFFGGDITHCLCHMQRFPVMEPDPEADRLTLMNIRTLTPVEIAAAQDILPWEEMPPL